MNFIDNYLFNKPSLSLIYAKVNIESEENFKHNLYKIQKCKKIFFVIITRKKQEKFYIKMIDKYLTGG